MARRGFIAALLHQSKVAARKRDRAQRAEVREHVAATRRAEQAKNAAARAQSQLERATAAERKRLEREARDAHIKDLEAEVEKRNLALAETFAELDSLLASTLEVDDFVDLATLRVVVENPPFQWSHLEAPVPTPESIPTPPEPIFIPPAPPKGLARLIGREKRQAADLATAQAAHEQALAEWRTQLKLVTLRRKEALEAHAVAERERIAALDAARSRYAKECEARETAASDQNRELDELIANLGYGTHAAVHEYISIVLANSVYPDHFPVSHTFDFDPESAELKLCVSVPGPSAIPEINAYKYTKSTDCITETPLAKRICRDRYASTIHQVALRSLHEVFEADRRGLIHTISLEVGTCTIAPATGRQTYLPFVVVAAERESFLELNLAAVIPAMTLKHLAAAVSNNPYGLEAVDVMGIRKT